MLGSIFWLAQPGLDPAMSGLKIVNLPGVQIVGWVESRTHYVIRGRIIETGNTHNYRFALAEETGIP